MAARTTGEEQGTDKAEAKVFSHAKSLSEWVDNDNKCVFKTNGVYVGDWGWLDYTS